MAKTVQEYFHEYSEKNYFGPKKGACSVLWFDKNDKATFLANNGCHGVLSSMPCHNGNMKAVYSSLRCRYPELYEAAVDYWDLIMSPTGPWRLAMKGIEVVKDTTDKPIAFGFTDMTVPTQVAASAMIQARVPQEYSNKLRSYWFFRQAGFDQVKSLWLSEHLIRDDKGFIYVNTESYQHAFNAGGSGISPHKLAKGEPTIHPAKLNASSTYGPVTAQWSGDQRKPALMVLVRDSESYTGNFLAAFKAITGKTTFENSGVLQGDKLVEKLKSNIKVWWFE